MFAAAYIVCKVTTAARLVLLAAISQLAVEPASRDLAIRRGIEYLRTIAANPQYFAAYGTDLLWCFYTISETSADADLRALTIPIAQGLARQWVERHSALSAHPDADELVDFATGSYAAKHLGLAAPGLLGKMRKAASQISVQGYLQFDPAHGPPPTYDIWCDALITTHSGKLAGVELGAAYSQVIRWLPAMRPYPASANDAQFYPALYAITHAIYTLNDYGVYSISPACFGPEFEFLKSHLPETIALADSETLGELLDTLRAFGLTARDPLIRSGVQFLLANQHPDGSWGTAKENDIYGRYHSTWTAIDGLREHRFHPARACPVLR